MKSKWWSSVFILSLAINIAAFSVAGYNYYCSAFPSSFSCPISPGDRHFYQELGLSPPQLARMEPLAREFHSGVEALMVEMHEKTGMLPSLLMEENAGQHAVESLRKEIAKLQDEIQKKFIDHIRDIKDILDEEQEKRFFRILRAGMEQERNQTFFQHRRK
jgi:Spy/CpxP family protein refolding chaperone